MRQKVRRMIDTRSFLHGRHMNQPIYLAPYPFDVDKGPKVFDACNDTVVHLEELWIAIDLGRGRSPEIRAGRASSALLSIVASRMILQPAIIGSIAASIITIVPVMSPLS